MCLATARASKDPPSPEEMRLHYAIADVSRSSRADLAAAFDEYADAVGERHVSLTRAMRGLAHLIREAKWATSTSTAGPRPHHPLVRCSEKDGSK